MNLTSITIPSIYGGTLPERMAKCAPDTAVGIRALANALQRRGGRLVLSDLFRSREMQQKAHADFTEGRKKAYSPPPGGSMHEAGRAIDIDLSKITIHLEAFWLLAKRCGWVPIIEAPDAGASEAWHFEHRGSHQLVYDYARAGKAGQGVKPARQMAVSAIIACGIPVDGLLDQGTARAQSALIRLGFDPGIIDGSLGPKTKAALDKFGGTVEALDKRVRETWPQEFAILTRP